MLRPRDQLSGVRHHLRPVIRPARVGWRPASQKLASGFLRHETRRTKVLLMHLLELLLHMRRKRRRSRTRASLIKPTEQIQRSHRIPNCVANTLSTAKTLLSPTTEKKAREVRRAWWQHQCPNIKCLLASTRLANYWRRHCGFWAPFLPAPLALLARAFSSLAFRRSLRMAVSFDCASTACLASPGARAIPRRRPEDRSRPM